MSEPGLREGAGEEGDGEEPRDEGRDEADEERDEADEDRGLEACADLLSRCLDLGVSDDTALRTFDECLSANVRDGEGEEEREGEEGREGDGTEGGEGGTEGDPDRPR